MGLLSRLRNKLKDKIEEKIHGFSVRRYHRKESRKAIRARRKFLKMMKKIDERRSERARWRKYVKTKQMLWRVFAASKMNRSRDYGMVSSLLAINRKQAREAAESGRRF